MDASGVVDGPIELDAPVLKRFKNSPAPKNKPEIIFFPPTEAAWRARAALALGKDKKQGAEESLVKFCKQKQEEERKKAAARKVDRRLARANQLFHELKERLTLRQQAADKNEEIIQKRKAIYAKQRENLLNCGKEVARKAIADKRLVCHEQPLCE